MAFAYTVQGYDVIGRLKHMWGTFTNGGGDTGGSIVTGFSQIKGGSFTDMSNATHDGVDVIDATTTGTMILTTDLGVDGIWEVFGT